MTTREAIIQSALEHFSLKGYDGVSMRNIACDVGIKAASIYNHFKGKQELMAAVYVSIEETLAGDLLAQEKVNTIDKKIPFGTLWQEWFDQYRARIRTSKYQDIIRILSMEQYTDSTAARLVLEYMFEKPLSIARDICKVYLPEHDGNNPDVIAAEFYYPMFGMMHELMLRMFHNLETESIEERMQEHIRFFRSIFDEKE